MAFRISYLCSGLRYMQIIKNQGHDLSGRWSRCIGGCYIEKSWPKNLREDRNMVVKDMWLL